MPTSPRVPQNQAPLNQSAKSASPLGEGDRRQAVEGFCGIFYVMCEVT